MNRVKETKGNRESNRDKEGLLETLLADLGKNYDPNAALNFLKLLEAQTGNEKQKVAKKNLKSLIENPPKNDTCLHIIYKTPYVLGEIVLAGKETLQSHPLCKYYPIHFKKTYLSSLSRWETNPSHEARQSHKIWQHFESENKVDTSDPKAPQSESGPVPVPVPVPLPLGSNATTYRSQLLEAKSLGSLNPVNSNGTQDEIVKQILFAKRQKTSLKKLWSGIEDLNQKINTLHSGGFLHNDLHKENLLLREYNDSMLGAIIDFETSEEDDRFQTLEWAEASKTDKRDFLKESCLIFLCSPQKEQDQILEQSPIKKDIINRLKSDPLFITIQKDLGKPEIPTKVNKYQEIQSPEV